MANSTQAGVAATSAIEQALTDKQALMDDSMNESEVISTLATIEESAAQPASKDNSTQAVTAATSNGNTVIEDVAEQTLDDKQALMDMANADQPVSPLEPIQQYIPPHVKEDSWQPWNISHPCPGGYTCTSMGNVSLGAFSCDELARVALEVFGFGNVLAGVYCPENKTAVMNCPVGGYCPNSVRSCLFFALKVHSILIYFESHDVYYFFLSAHTIISY